MTFTNLKMSRTSIRNQIGQMEKIASSGVNGNHLRGGLKLKIQLLDEFCHLSCDIISAKN